MPFEVGAFILDLCDKFMAVPLVKTVINNPLYTALFIAFIIILIVALICGPSLEEDSRNLMLAKVGFYTFIVVAGVVFLHNKQLLTETKKGGSDKNLDHVFNNASATSLNPDGIGAESDFVPIKSAIIPVDLN